jgi:hypothetical protein
MTQLDISENELRPDGTKALVEGLKGNNIITELNIASNNLSYHGSNLSGFIALAGVITGMGALTSLHVGKNRIPTEEMRKIMAVAVRMDNMKVLCEIPFKDKTVTELDVSGKKLGMEGALVVAEYLDGNGTISSVNLLKNDIGVEQARALVSILKEHPTLKSLCGNNGDETELDMSGKMDCAEDAIMLAAEIVDNGAMTKFTFSGDKSWIQRATMETTMTEADFSGKALGVSGGMMVAAFLPKCQ